jgi:hypothetical protein
MTINSSALSLFSNIQVNSGSGSPNIIDVSSVLNDATDATQQSSLSLYNYYEANGAKLQKANNTSAAVKAAVTHFETAIKTVTSVNQLFSDPKLSAFISEALGLGDQSQTQALFKQSLTGYVIPQATYQSLISAGLLNTNGVPTSSTAKATLIKDGYLDPKNPTKVSVANQLSNTNYLNAALQLNLATTGLKTIQSSATIATLVSQYQTYSFEDTIAAKSSTVEQARYFALRVSDTVAAIVGTQGKNGSTISAATSTSVVYAILGDKTLRDVISTIYNIPASEVVQPIASQERLFASKINIQQLTNPKFVSQLTQRFLINSDLTAQSSSQTSGVLSLFN